MVSTTAETIQQHIYYMNKNLKKDLLLHIIKDDTIEQALVFQEQNMVQTKLLEISKRNTLMQLQSTEIKRCKGKKP